MSAQWQPCSLFNQGQTLSNRLFSLNVMKLYNAEAWQWSLNIGCTRGRYATAEKAKAAAMRFARREARRFLA